jgi:16S rRNA (cytosine967-C5)-methyltransferase
VSRRPPEAPRVGRPPGRRTDSRRGGPDSVRSVAVWVLERTLAARAPLDAHLASAAERFDDRDGRLLRELVLGTLRWLRRLDQVIEAASSRPIEEVQTELRAVLRVAAFQLLFLDRVPPHAAVSEAVDQAGSRSHRGGAGFVNAVLRRIARQPRLEDWPVGERDPVRRLAIETSHPDVLVRRWLARMGEAETLRLLEANNRPKPLHLLAFRDRGGRELLAEELIDEGLEVEPTRLSPVGLTVREGSPFATLAFERGLFYVQDEASQAAALVPAPGPGERVLDAAASPGGKGLALLAAEPSARLVAADLGVGRLALIGENSRRLERRIARVAADAAAPPFAAAFDRVILDFPCSGTGTLRKNPELKWRWSEAELARLAGQASRLLAGAASAVAPGGLLVAISCSLEPEENEALAGPLLAAVPELAPEPLEHALDGALRGFVVAPGLWRLPTGGEHDGFTVQVFRRRR